MAMTFGMKQDPPLVTRIPHWEKLPEAEAREGVLDHEVYLKVRELLPGYARLALVLGYHTGARRGELLAIRLILCHNRLMKEEFRFMN